MNELSTKIKKVLQKINEKDFYKEHFKALIDEDDGYESFEAFCNNDIFYVDKLLVAMEEYNNFKADKSFYEGMKEHLHKVSNGKGYTARVIESFKSLEKESKLIEIVITIIGYYDVNGYDEFNDYKPKKRNVCMPWIWQDKQIEALIQYKIDSVINSNSIDYLMSNCQRIPISSKNHVDCIKDKINFVNDFSTELEAYFDVIFKDLNIAFKNPQNKMLFIMHVLYGKNIKSLWYKIDPALTEEQDQARYSEGSVTYTTKEVKRIERSAKLISMFKAELRTNNQLYCHVCDFNFEDVYGELGQGYIEAHHIKPVAQLKQALEQNYQEAKQNLIALCANCHRMVHQDRSKTLSIEELKKILKKD